MRIFEGRNLIVGLVVLMGLFCASPALAANVTFHVQTTADGNQSSPGTTNCASNSEAASGKCTLRSSIEAADNEPSGTDVTIIVPAGTYKFTVPNETCIAHCQPSNSYSLNVLSGGPSSVTIMGAGASSTIVDANYLDRAFDLASGPTVTISGLTIEHGRSGGIGHVSNCPSAQNEQPVADGGGILAQGVLKLAHDTLTDNIASGGGGGLADTGSDQLTISHTAFSKNSACQSSTGFSSRNGGGVDIQGDSPVSIDSSVITDNSASPNGNGGGLDLESGGPVVQVTNTTISDNSAFSGAGISNDAGGTETYFADTISGNRASNNGGGFQDDNRGTDTFVNTTIVGNSAPSDGGGMWEGGTGTISFSTITDNSSPGGTGNVSQGGEAAGTVNIDDSIVSSPTKGSNCAFGVTDKGYNLFDHSSDCGASAGNHDVFTTDPKLGSLADNGGPTKTEALLPGSRAVDSASKALCASETKNSAGHQVDQREIVSRPQGSRCDIGAFEATPDLGVTASPAQNSIFVGQQDTITDTIDNSGPTNAVNSTFSDPAGGTFKIDSVKTSQGTCTHSATSIDCQLNTISPGGKVTISFVITGLSPGTVTFKSSADTGGQDLDQGNNHAVTSVLVKSKPKPPPPPPKKPKPSISIARLGPACYRQSSTIHVTATAKAAAGIKSAAISVTGHGFSNRSGYSTPSGKTVKKQTLHDSIPGSRLHPGATYRVTAKVVDTMGRSAEAHTTFMVCKPPPKRGFTG